MRVFARVGKEKVPPGRGGTVKFAVASNMRYARRIWSTT